MLAEEAGTRAAMADDPAAAIWAAMQEKNLWTATGTKEVLWRYATVIRKLKLEL